MLKGGSEVIHQHGALDSMQQSNEHWDCASLVGFPGITSAPNYPSKPITDRGNNPERNELSQWVEHVTRQLIEDFPENETEAMTYQDNIVPALLGELRSKKVARRNSSESMEQQHQWNSHDLARDENNMNINETGTKGMNGLDDQGLNLITHLLECAVAISVDNLGEAHRMLLELTQMSSPYGPSCAERVVVYFAKAMASRVINSWLGICSPLINYKSVHCAFQVFNNISPFIKFAHFTSNQAILEAFHRRDRVHIIDVDIMQGLQWPALFHILATRIEGPPHVTMTGMGTSMELLIETGKQLSSFAKRLGMSFEFHPIGKKIGELDITMLQIRRGEAIAIHWLQHSLYDATGPDWKTMRLLQEVSPRVITLVEQEIPLGGSFLDRFVGSLHYYSTIFDSLGAFLHSDDSSRHNVEHGLLYREINNILAIGGPARNGEDKFKHWRSELSRNGFMQVPMSTNAMAQAQLILNMFPPVHGYSLVQGDGTLKLGWKDTSLYTASAWTSPNSR
ncbi:scarecrow-like protein 23 [Nicotiana tomentosiformis]|uniref:scarecrow-like protein 23 n=1 Tax=Nicotiana tomentosiformis TaxID=4098 RepID=UPI00051B3654|nr:protein SCARECROW-like [Nicotiana tomentosiformis]